MSGRLTRKVVSFAYPFFLDEADDLIPAGAYTVEMEDESRDGRLLPGGHVVSTTLVMRSVRRRKRRVEYLAIGREGLAGALQRDRDRSALDHLTSSRELAELGAAARKFFGDESTPVLEKKRTFESPNEKQD